MPADADSQAYPSKPIKVVFPYPAGSPIEVIGRLVCDEASRVLGQPVVFENRPGANGLLGMAAISAARPDGYTIGLSTTSSMFNNFYRRKPLYDPLADFVPISAVMRMPAALIVRASLPMETVEDFIDYVRRHPGTLNYASTGPGSFNHLMMEQLKSAAGLDIVHVPYQGASAIATELLAGRVDATIISVGSLMQPWKAGKVKVLASMTTAPTADLPDLPAIVKAVPRLRPFDSWLGFVAPRDTSPAVVATLNAALVRAVATPGIRRRIEDEHFDVLGTTPKAFADMIRGDFGRVEEAFKASGLQPE